MTQKKPERVASVRVMCPGREDQLLQLVNPPKNAEDLFILSVQEAAKKWDADWKPLVHLCTVHPMSESYKNECRCGRTFFTDKPEEKCPACIANAKREERHFMKYYAKKPDRRIGARN